jgi:hypothetical protein
MELWRYLLQADRKLDLCRPGEVEKWLESLPWGWHESFLLPGWARSLKAFRSVAGRLKGRRIARPSELDETSADRVMHHFLGFVRPWPELKKGKLTATSFRGLRLFPTYLAQDRPQPTLIVAVAELKAGFPNSEVFWWDDALLFWQLCFLGLLEESGPSICQGCGKVLGALTPTGRKTKRSACGNCRWKKYWKDLPDDCKREKWKADFYKKTKGEKS